MTFVRKTALAACIALLAAAGGARAADLELEQDRYETSRPDDGGRWQDRTVDPREDPYRRRYADDEEDDLGPVPPRNVGPRIHEERRYGSYERYETGRRFAPEGRGWHRRVVGPPGWPGDADCRTVITRRFKPWGEVVERRRIVCE
jgi:hypothetical protein